MDEKLRQIQAELRRRGYAINVDGLWGPKTRDAVALALGIVPEIAKAPKQPQPELIAAPWLDLAHEHIGVKEWAELGSNNPQVIEYYREAGVPQQNDEVPWCAAFVGAILRRAGYEGTRSLMARSYLKWGRTLKQPVRGCVVVLTRGAAPSGHVAFVDTWTPTVLRCIGGNQGNAVSIANYPRSQVLGFRWPVEAAA